MENLKSVRSLSLVLLVFAFLGCTSKLVVQSEPAGAGVFFIAPRSDKKIAVGTTPFEISDSEFKSKLMIDPYQLPYFTLEVQKEGFQAKDLLVPGTRFGSLETLLFVKLDSAKEGVAAKELLQYLMNAQQFAQDMQYGRAHDEVEKALKIDSKFARAVSMKGAIYYVEKNYPESLKWYERSLALDNSQQDVVKMVTHLRARIQGGGQ